MDANCSLRIKSILPFTLCFEKSFKYIHQKYIFFYLECFLQKPEDKERLSVLKSEIEASIPAPQENHEPDPGWLSGTSADSKPSLKVNCQACINFV